MIDGLRTWLRLQLPLREPPAEMQALLTRLDEQGRTAEALSKQARGEGDIQNTIELIARDI
ncbi:hypothetical protein HME9302_00021 [Alteripontixanthobacter maritimus]|uniref:Uncharacterized protein n=1 Tax=Alteripontixanthobacter maritimus TaxID=2161824 RepID=A0A369QQA0_9SPHN|nr:hypothetical protein [Alteripontixanthobacter maritimus]RDC59800.1 hypothetical protein HME9302_00995 [Alteripontixanthobacter maritimus]RDC66570.1 hypothetical protein HME9302_00021 [Alteripontixanthobacter maritimus]